MHVRQIVLGIVLGGLVSSPEFARVQGRRNGMGMQDGRGPASGAILQREPRMPPRRGRLDPLAAPRTAGPRTLDAPLPLRTRMVQLVGRMATLGRGTRGAATATPLAGLRARLTKRPTGPAARLGASPPEAPEAEGRAPRLGQERPSIPCACRLRHPPSPGANRASE